MRAVVDTNVVAYFLLGNEEYRDECEAFWSTVREPMAPASWEVELTNVLWMAVRKNVVSPEEGLHRLDLASSLGMVSIPVSMLWRGALTRAAMSGIAVHDSVFVELADREKVPLVTFDQPLVRAFPELARRPRDLPPGR